MKIINFGTKKDGVSYKFRETCYGVARIGGKILLVYSKKDKDFSLPGGGLEDNEQLEDGLKREFLEESGYQVKTAEHFADSHVFAKNSKGEYIKRLAHYFFVDVDVNDSRVPEEDWHEPMWVKLEDVCNVLSHPAQKDVLKKCKICWNYNNLG